MRPYRSAANPSEGPGRAAAAPFASLVPTMARPELRLPVVLISGPLARAATPAGPP